jgi:hypothetical protein
LSIIQWIDNCHFRMVFNVGLQARHHGMGLQKTVDNKSIPAHDQTHNCSTCYCSLSTCWSPLHIRAKMSIVLCRITVNGPCPSSGRSKSNCNPQHIIRLRENTIKCENFISYCLQLIVLQLQYWY